MHWKTYIFSENSADCQTTGMQNSGVHLSKDTPQERLWTSEPRQVFVVSEGTSVATSSIDDLDVAAEGFALEERDFGAIIRVCSHNPSCHAQQSSHVPVPLSSLSCVPAFNDAALCSSNHSYIALSKPLFLCSSMLQLHSAITSQDGPS